ncbi:hypothetical protein MVEN_00058900 [Mycena venus]|uniref:Zinc finger PHD-type domain-containing protein n=1 Tax=Mycena venus TaxID=2733690 RepID=A0A8H6Z762_9AGAR|nr:hypothetical protein MVEN_00058900 [Mycena venus]
MSLSLKSLEDELHDLPPTSAPLYNNGETGALHKVYNLWALIEGHEGTGNASLAARRIKRHSHRPHPYKRPPISTPAPEPAARASSRSRNKAQTINTTPTNKSSKDDIKWDGWPDGDFSALFSMGFVERHNNLHVHWATRALGGRGGSTEAETWEGGKLTRRQCQGVIQCEGHDCTIVTRPQTRTAGLEKQLSQPCECGANRIHYPCEVRSTLHTFSGGVYYQNGGTHDHPRPTVRLHLGKEEREAFAMVVNEQPTTGPLKLLVGRPTASGPAESVAKISPLLVNADRIKYERSKLLRAPGGYRGEHFLKEFAKFEASNPNFIRTAQFGQVAVIVMQTPFMASTLIKSIAVDTEAVNGIVSDGAHGFWREYNDILMISSTYEPINLKCWVPGLFSYSNGQTEEHYAIHFGELFDSMREECLSRGIELTDEIFANIMDFSAAQRGGFISAFIAFWQRWAPGQRDAAELREAAIKLLKGCAQHFRNQVTRIKKISGVVDPAQIDVFENYARELLECKDIQEFTTLAGKFKAAFPRAETWFSWWELPSHACMLFPSFRIMNSKLWNSIPGTTNAQEAMHFKLYAALGRKLGLMEGLKGLVAFAEYYRTQFEAKKHGLKIHYGEDRERWKVNAKIHGRTHFNRHARVGASKNDGRPPDTAKALLGRRKQSHRAPEYEKGYKWKDSSCWLDSSLMALFSAASRDYEESMVTMFSGLPESHPLRDFQQMIHTRIAIGPAGYEEGGCTLLSNGRDGFRKILLELPRSNLKSLSDFQSAFGWLHNITESPTGLARRQLPPSIERALSYFRMRKVILRQCSGSDFDHFQLERIKWRSPCGLNPELCKWYKGGPAEMARDGEKFCDGHALQYEVVLNIPLTLVIEMGDIAAGNTWKIPEALYPYPNNAVASAHRVKYSIASHVYLSPTTSHFITRYSSGTRIFDYDGMKRDGNAILREGTLKGLLTGASNALKEIPSGYFPNVLIYHLDGGEAAQNYFRAQQIKLAKKLHLYFETKNGFPFSCELRRPHLETLTEENRWWLEGPSSAIDYREALPSRPQVHLKRTNLDGPQNPLPHDAALASHQLRLCTYHLFRILVGMPFHPTVNCAATLAAKRGTVWEDSDPISCQKCGYWSHIACVQPLAYEDSDSDAESQLSWHNPQFVFVCALCKLRDDTPECDPSLGRPGKIHVLPEIGEWSYSTMWYPAEFIDFDVTRQGREYEFKWIPGIVWTTGEPQDLTFYRSIAQWVEVDAIERLREEQIGSVRLPQCLKAVQEDAESLNPQLLQLFLLAVPTIARILALEDSNPVTCNFRDHFKEVRWSVEASLRWMKGCLFEPTPALDAMLNTALGELSAHELMRTDPLANRKIWGPGSVLFQLLAIQHSLDEPLNLNGDTFLNIQAGRLRLSPPQAVEGLHEMWLAFDPVVRAREIQNQMSTSRVLEWEARFKAAHTVFENSADLVFYRRDVGWNPEIIPPRPAVNIWYNERAIILLQDLPPPEQQGEKRAFVGEDIFGDGPVPKRRKKMGSNKTTKKYEPKPTPPHARRSSRLKGKKRE